uniref:Inhibitor_I29 domain-containing protein n=1 Tax=Macrostomum lignano TaxID=282301 RepID=A0A1I8FNK7_9PLAT
HCTKPREFSLDRANSSASEKSSQRSAQRVPPAPMLRSAILVCLAAAICTNQQMVVASQTPEYVVTTILLEAFATQDINGRWNRLLPDDCITELAGRLGFRGHPTSSRTDATAATTTPPAAGMASIGEVYDKRADFAAAPSH